MDDEIASPRSQLVNMGSTWMILSGHTNFNAARAVPEPQIVTVHVHVMI